MGFIHLFQDFQHIITTTTSVAVNNIGSSIIYTALDIDVRNWHRKSNLVSTL